ncbi:hypothetical protein D3C86_1890790 [compost metagenome]
MIKLRSRAPIREKCKVRGIGVAVNVKESTLARNSFNFSFTETPNFCSSSIIINPKSLNLTSLLTNLCVPMMISILPSANLAKVSLICFAVLNLLI